MEAVWDRAGHAPSGAQYSRHRPEETLLYQIIDDYYPDFVAQLESERRSLPRFVSKEFEEYLKCGRLEHGFLRVRCADCHAEKLGGFLIHKAGLNRGEGQCGAVKVIASIENPQVIGQILSHLGLDRPQAERRRLPAPRAPP